MTGILKNRLLLYSLAIVVAYWISGALIPNPFLSSTMSLMLLIFGSVTLFRYGPSAARILFLGERSADQDGGHLAAYGVALVALGSVYVGIFGLAWVYTGQPSDWLGTATSGFGRGLMAAGFCLLFFAPDVTRRRFKFPGGAWLLIAIATVLVVTFALGWRAGTRENMATWRTARLALELPACPADRPIQGASRSLIYHTPESPYRELIRPARCFEDESEARRAGYRAPR